MSFVLPPSTNNFPIQVNLPPIPGYGEVWRCRIRETGVEFDAVVENMMMDVVQMKPQPGTFPEGVSLVPGTVEFLHKIPKEQA